MGATVASRRIGSARTTGVVVPVSAVLMVTIFALSQAQMPADLSVLGGALVVGFCGSILYFVGYTAFRLGPISIVAPIFSAGGGLTVLFAILFLAERPTPLNLVAVAVATLGVALAALVREEGSGRLGFAGPGVRYAIVVLVVGAILPIITTLVVRQAGWLPALTTARLANAAVVALVLVGFREAQRRRAARPDAEAVMDAAPGPAGPLDGRTRLLLVVIATAEVLALSCFYAGVAIGPTWLVALTSSFGPLVVIAGGVLMLRERPRRVQWMGVALILTSGILLAVR